MPALLPAPLHRALLPLAHGMRHSWRRWRKVPIAGVSIIITNLGGDVLLLRHSYGPDVWGLPGGGINRGEEPEAAARREVREELGIELARLEPIGTLEEVLSGSPHTAHLFAAICNQHPRPDGREVVEARFFPSHSLPEPLGRTTRARIAAWKARGTG
ncbi:NUDIX hydrolase [Erythrobacter sanguineus]|uniref:ADP-ribose pyrophosphatase YjhB, NUDIX family n=1 Tax=Erythrobacter sanguineus TaxID=198312 RepID=A0A1M7SMQ7_9SPHN|nr:NUDIX domain-containing protein [Erythrobacter sanguineus]SHN59755.1 ADP-ribose pyrophosphatase YjhB, NUDIX family [Erythrobacter sanguineus]